MDKKSSVLQSLFIDESAAIEGAIRDTLEPYLGLSKSSDKIIAKADFQGLNNKRKIVMYLLARQAMKILGVPGAAEHASGEKIAAEIMVNPKTTREELSRLKGKYIERTEGGEWYLPTYRIMIASAFIKS